MVSLADRLSWPAAVSVLIQKDDLAAADAAFREAQSRPHFDAALVAAVALARPPFGWLRAS